VTSYGKHSNISESFQNRPKGACAYEFCGNETKYIDKLCWGYGITAKCELAVGALWN